MKHLLLFSLLIAVPAFLRAQFSGGSQARDQSANISAVDSAVVVESGSQLLVALGPQIGVPYWIALSYTGQLEENLPAEVGQVWDILGEVGSRPRASTELFRVLPDEPEKEPADLPPGEAMRNP